MSTTIGTLEIEMAANIARLSADLGAARAEVNKVMGDIQRSVDKMQTDMQASFNGISSAMMKMQGVFVGAFAAISGGNAIIGIASDFEQLEIKLNSVMGSAQAGDAAFSWIKQFAVNTPFSVKDTTDAFMRLKNFGLDPMDGTLQKVADSAAKYTTGTDGMSRVTLALGQAWGRGKLQGQDILQMIDAGIPVWDLLAKTTGKSVTELQSMSEKGELTREIMRKLVDTMGSDAAGLSAAKMNSLAGSVSNMGDAFENAIDKVRKQGGFDFLTQGVQTLTTTIPPVVDIFATGFAAIADVVKAAWQVINDVFGSIGQIIGSVFGQGTETMTGMELFMNMLKVIQVALFGFRIGFAEVFEFVKMLLAATAAQIINFGEATYKALKLDFSGAKAAWQQGLNDSRTIFAQGMSNIVDIAQKGKSDIDKAIMGDSATLQVNDTKQKPLDNGSTNSGKKPKSHVAEYEAQLNELKQARDRENEVNHTFFDFSKSEERAYWQTILQARNLSKEERIAVERKLLDASIAVRKEEAQTQQEDMKRQIEAARAGSIERIQVAMQAATRIGEQYGLESREYRKAMDEVRKAALERAKEEEKLEQMRSDAARNASLHLLSMERERLRLSKQLGDISAIDEINALRDLENRKYQIELKSAEDRAALVEAEPIAYQQAMDRIAQIKQQHDLEMQRSTTALAQAQRDEALQMFQPFTNAFEKSVTAMIQGTVTFNQAMRNMAQSILMEFVNMGVKMVAQWLANEAAKTLASTTGTSMRTTLETSAATATKSIAVSTANVEVGAKAASSAAGAASSQAAIPFAGWGLAAAAFASVMAMVLGAKGVIASAAGGFDIPAGLNPMTQLHEREMVLPAEHADTIRGLSGNGSQQPINIQLSTFDTQGVKRFLMDNGNVIADSLRAQARNFKTI